MRIVSQIALLFYFCNAFSINENYYGLEHQRVATECIFKAVSRRFRSHALITILARDDLDSPGYEIESHLISALASSCEWTVEVTNGSRKTFESYSECLNCDTNDLFEEQQFKNHYQAVIQTDYYIIILDKLDTLVSRIDTIKEMSTFRIDATYFIYFYVIVPDYEKIINDIFHFLYLNAIYKVVILVATSQTEFQYYGYDLYRDSTVCASHPEVVSLNTCTNGSYKSDKFKLRNDFKNLNCIINTIVMVDPPFVVDANTGFEINLLHEIELSMNVSFNVSSSSEEAEDWGSKENGEWTHLLGILAKNPFMIGIGSVWVTAERQEDFDYTDYYYIDKTIWVVPSALEMPKWKSLLHIFPLFLWICLLSLFIIFGTFFYCASRNNSSEYNVYKHFGAGFVLSFQIFIGHSASTQPKSRVLRILFIHQAMFCIIIGCSFQSGLIGVMSKPKFYDEIDSDDGVFASGIGIGGISAFKDIFNQSDPRSVKIYNNYEIYDEVNDTLFIWLLTVAKDRDTITILNEAYVKYQLAIGKHGIVNHDGTPKVYIVPEILYTFSVGIIFYKGYPLKEGFNEVIRGLTHAGLIEKWRNEFFFRHQVDEEDEVEEEYHDSSSTAISFKDISGAFAFLVVGYISGTTAFGLELLVRFIGGSNQFKGFWKKTTRKHTNKSIGMQTVVETTDKASQVCKCISQTENFVNQLHQRKHVNKY